MRGNAADRWTISVVIPTQPRRYGVLQKVLTALAHQENPGPFEVLVSTDGPLPRWHERFPFVRWLRVNDPTPAAKRNRGMEEAIGELILFLDDDVVPNPDVLRAHREGHREFPDEHVVLIGEVEWLPEVRKTALGFFVEWGHVYLDYKRWKPGETVPSYAFYAGHLSGKRAFLLQARFDPGYRALAYEDADFGFQLPDLRIVFWPRARARHHKHLTWDDMARRARAIGTMRPYFLSRNPHRRHVLDSVVRKGKEWLRRLAGLDSVSRRLARHPRPLGIVYTPIFALTLLGHLADALPAGSFAPDAVSHSTILQESANHARA